MTVSPLQLAVAYAALANGGTVFEPRVAKAIMSPTGKLIKRIKAPVRDHLPVQQSDIDYIRNAMYGVVVETAGTAYGLYFAQLPDEQGAGRRQDRYRRAAGHQPGRLVVRVVRRVRPAASRSTSPSSRSTRPTRARSAPRRSSTTSGTRSTASGPQGAVPQRRAADEAAQARSLRRCGPRPRPRPRRTATTPRREPAEPARRRAHHRRHRRPTPRDCHRACRTVGCRRHRQADMTELSTRSARADQAAPGGQSLRARAMDRESSLRRLDWVLVGRGRGRCASSAARWCGPPPSRFS